MIDVGADAYWIRMMSNKKAHCDNNHLLLFEPNPHAITVLQNTSINELKNIFSTVNLVPKAAANFTGQATYYFNDAAPSPSKQGALIEGGRARNKFPDHPAMVVNVTTVDSIIMDMESQHGLTVNYVPYFKVAARGMDFEVSHP